MVVNGLDAARKAVMSDLEGFCSHIAATAGHWAECSGGLGRLEVPAITTQQQQRRQKEQHQGRQLSGLTKRLLYPCLLSSSSSGSLLIHKAAMRFDYAYLPLRYLLCMQSHWQCPKKPTVTAKYKSDCNYAQPLCLLTIETPAVHARS
jgi:hypothetical protein